MQFVLEQREKARKAAEEALAEAKKALRVEQQKLAALEEERRQVDVRKKKAGDEFSAALSRPGTNIAEEATLHDNFQRAQDAEAKRLDGLVQQQFQAVRRAQGRVEDAMLALTRAAADLQAMEKHKENWLREVKKEALVKEQNEQEELGQAMWLQQQREMQARQQAQRGGE
ncbi:MAG: hypothetical protein ACRELB_23475 [Polyangiaceae bacterium]